jgi:hypothetical protein
VAAHNDLAFREIIPGSPIIGLAFCSIILYLVPRQKGHLNKRPNITDGWTPSRSSLRVRLLAAFRSVMKAPSFAKIAQANSVLHN